MPEDRVLKMKKAHEILTEIPFEVVTLEKGYAHRWLRVDLIKNEITLHPVSPRMKELWTGGKGFDLWLMFQEIHPDTKWNSPENPICFSSGPLGGTTSFPGSGKTLVTALSPLTQSVMDCNVGGYFGPYLKFAGFDALMVIGKAKEDIIILIDAVKGKITVEKSPLESLDTHLLAEELTDMYSDDELDRRNIACVSAGRGAEHTRMGVLNFSFWDWRRGGARVKQAGRGGIGTVFRDKKIKALVIKNRQITPAWRIEENKAAKLITPGKPSLQACAQEVRIIGEIIDKWDRDPEYVIEMMQDIQDRFRHVSKTAIEEIRNKTGKPLSHLYHIATFYKAFSLQPKGETTIQVCMGTACHVKGSARILDSFERVLNIKSGETTADNKYSLEAVACLGACSIAPVVKIGGEIFGNVQAQEVETLLEKAGAGIDRESWPRKEAAEPASARLKPQDLEKIVRREKKTASGYRAMLMVCTGTGCVSAKGFDIRNRLNEVIKERKLEKDYLVVGTGCNGFCAMGPIVVVQPEGTFYQQVRKTDVEEIVQGLVEGQVVERLLHRDPVSKKVNEKMQDIAFFSKQQLIALRNKGLIDPENIDHYIARGGYQALKNVLAGMPPEDVRKEIIASGIRGRGGGGFPAGIKWESGSRAARERKEEIFVVCNADEGDPGAFMDRSIIETDPHSVIEGMCIGAYATGAREGLIYIRKEYPLAMERLKKAISQCRAYGLLGRNILHSGFDFDIHIHRGAGAFVCGESSALMASLAGKAGEPRSKYVHSVEYGFRDKPTVLNNVETWANIPVIVDKGASWFASIGTGDVSENPWNGSSGTKVFSLVGDIRNTGLVEVPMGITLREIVEEVGGGIPDGHRFKAVQTGGPSGGCLPESKLDMKVDFDSLTEAGSMMGSGGMIVMNDKTCMVDVARYFVDFLIDESCGKCTACREGLHLMSNLLGRICNGEGRAGDIEKLEELCDTVRETSLCQLGGSAPNPVLSTLKYFGDEYREHIEDKKCRAGICKALITYRISETNCTGCTLCAKRCPVKAISGEAKKVHTLDGGKCIKCGICYEVCKFDAVEVI
ncbi:MAG: NAD(P)H-dependent oxidoreductase subunit E [Candidatus Krumholzibacteriota bacterium]|nr:NAD(P)H-dependent oxidoreductase subunit E [Candidatus Krumholzibacteriota bacterium]